MKKKLLTMGVSIMALILLVGGINSMVSSDVVLADTGDSQRLVTVNGVGEILVTPDQATISIGVQTKNDDAKIAQEENATLMSAVIEAIKNTGVPEKDIKTSGYSLYQGYDDVISDSVENKKIYYANNNVSVTINDIENVGQIIDIATKAGANNINSIQFSISDDSVYYQQALTLAMENAKGKAETIMKTFSKTAGEPYSVTEISYGGTYSTYSNVRTMDEMTKASTTPVEAGGITITANVSVSYDY